MRLNDLRINALIEQAKGMRFEPPASALSKWQPEIHAASDDDESTINIYDVIGEDPWSGQGMTPKIVSAVLRKNKGRAVTVNINSPGGSFFDGVAIYNLLKEHDGDVHVRVVGMAASAASIVAMAGTSIEIAKSAFIMIHNAWTIAIGNKLDMQDVADTLEKFDLAMAGIYAEQTGKDEKAITKMLDQGDNWIQGPEAVKQGFATGLLEADDLAVDDETKSSHNSALKQVDRALASIGRTRSERNAIIKDLTSKPGAAVQDDPKPGAGQNEELCNQLQSILNNLKT